MLRLHRNIGFEKAIKPITLEQKKMSDGSCKIRTQAELHFLTLL